MGVAISTTLYKFMPDDFPLLNVFRLSHLPHFLPHKKLRGALIAASQAYPTSQKHTGTLAGTKKGLPQTLAFVG